MRIIKSGIFLFLLSVIFVSCVSTSATMLSSKTFPPLTPEEVTIYLSEDDIPGEYERIAIINARGDSGMTNERQLYEAVRKRAAKIGANGVLHAVIEEPGSGAKVAAAVFGTSTSRKAEMIAIFVHH